MFQEVWGQTGVTSAILGWPQCLPRSEVGLSPSAMKRRNWGQWNLVTMTTTESKSQRWAGCVKADGTQVRLAGTHWDSLHSLMWFETAGSSHMPRCRGPSNCRCCQTVSLFVAEVCLPQQACHLSPTCHAWEQGIAHLSSIPARARRCVVLFGAAEWAAPGKAGRASQIPGH